jgi:hypothetical protein
LTSGDTVGDYAQVRELCHANPLVAWAAYIGGSIFTLLKEESVSLPYGFSFLLLSAVPMNEGIGSSAAAEIGTLSCLNAYLGLQLDGARIARLGQMRQFAGRVTFAVQQQPEDYGHAVYQTKKFAGGEFVLLGLGDHLFRDRPVSPYQELAQMAAVSNGRSV